MPAVTEGDDAPPIFVIGNPAAGQTFEWQPPADVWIKLQAFSIAADLTPEQVIGRAIAEFVAEKKR
jgi:hypothetical protein